MVASLLSASTTRETLSECNPGGTYMRRITAITFERTMCYGSCPVFTARFLGRYGHIRSTDLESSYSIPYTDLPSRIITVETETITKSVTDYGPSGPPGVRRIELALWSRLRSLGLAQPIGTILPAEEESMPRPGEKAAATRKRRAAAKKAATTRKRTNAGSKAAITRKRRSAGKKAAVTRKRSQAAKKATATSAARKADATK
jgi:hypothetical protein